MPQGHFDDALLTADTNALEPEVLEYKLYAPDVGPGPHPRRLRRAGREELLSTRTVDPTTRPGRRHSPARDALRVAAGSLD